uniref:Secreted protein n=1 Tax=Ditylenchus dipsaci TaxID=166011 RepID=A0A915E861_9BILA
MSSGNVLVLLNTLYTSGFASMSPTIPMLTKVTGLWLVGSSSCVRLYALCSSCDAVRGKRFCPSTQHHPYNSGLAVIWEEFRCEWVHSFNNFRVAFLFMIFHDVPISTANFFFISSCRCAGPNVT